MTDYDDEGLRTRADAERMRAEAEVREQADEAARDEDYEANYSDDAMFAEMVGAEALASYNLRRIRTALGMSQQQIAEELIKQENPVRLGQSQIAKIERGERPWRLNELMAIAKIMRVDFTDLLEPEGIASDEAIQLLSVELELGRVARSMKWQEEGARETARRYRDAANNYLEVAAWQQKKTATVDRILRERFMQQKWIEFAAKQIDELEGESASSQREEMDVYVAAEWARILSSVDEGGEEGE